MPDEVLNLEVSPRLYSIPDFLATFFSSFLSHPSLATALLFHCLHDFDCWATMKHLILGKDAIL